MLNTVLSMQKEKKYLIYGLSFFSVYLVLYTVLDTLNGGYEEMQANFGVWLVVLNIFLNVFMSAVSAVMMNLSTAFVKLSGKEGKGSFFSSFAVLFGMLTYGCTSCVIAFFATIGVTFSVIALPLAGFPYKVLALLLLLVGGVWLIAEIKRGRCKIKPLETNSPNQ